MPFFQNPWPPFRLDGVDYDLSHLNEYIFEMEDSAGNARRILVNFTDHCFTRDWKDQDTFALSFPNCSRKPRGAFCPLRYSHSLHLRDHIRQAVLGEVWIAEGEAFAIVPIVDHQGKQVLYCIVFDLLKVESLPCHIRMLVRTAYPMDAGRSPTTFGNIRFRHLLTLRMRGQRPPRNTDHRRKRPKIK